MKPEVITTETKSRKEELEKILEDIKDSLPVEFFEYVNIIKKENNTYQYVAEVYILISALYLTFIETINVKKLFIKHLKGALSQGLCNKQYSDGLWEYWRNISSEDTK